MHRKLRLLHVDDDADDYLLVKSYIFKGSGGNWLVDHAQSLSEAIAKLDVDYDAFLVDYRLGGSTGLDVIREIRTRVKHAPIILLTGMVQNELDWEALEAGANDYLIKGEFDEALLLRSLRYALKHAELVSSLDSAARRFKNIFELSGDPIALINSNGGLVASNAAFNHIFIGDSKPADINFFDIVTDANFSSKITLAMKDGENIESVETKLYDADKKPFPAIISVIGNDQISDVFHIMIKDLTAVRLRQDEHISLQKFSASGRMSRMLAHEIKNPLTTILLSVEQLAEELPSEVLHDAGDLLDVVRRNSNRINELLTTLLHSTKFEDLHIEKINLNQLLEETLKEVDDRITLEGIKIIKQFSSEICEISIDSEKVKIALSNILVNAAEALSEKSDPLIKVKTEIKDGKCVISITDNGSGIEPEDLERLFEPFFTKKQSGTGLGLANTQRIVLSHGGSIRVESSPGEGTTFYVSFNMNDGSAS